MPANKRIRSVIIEIMIAKNGKLDRSHLEKLSDDALVEQAKAEIPALSGLTADILRLSDDVFALAKADAPTLADLNLDNSRLKPSNLEIRSSAPYSKGSSDGAMLSSPRRRW